MFKILVADTETTGQSRKDKICELAFIQIDHDLNVVREWSSLIDPEGLPCLMCIKLKRAFYRRIFKGLTQKYDQKIHSIHF